MSNYLIALQDMETFHFIVTLDAQMSVPINVNK